MGSAISVQSLCDDETDQVNILIGPPNLDLSVATPQVSQAGATIDSAGNLQVATGVPIQISVPVSGSGFNSPETRSTTVTLQASSQPLQSRTISLADIQSGAVNSVAFTVTFDPSLAGTTQTITATVDPGNALNETNFLNNTASVQVDVISCTSLINNALTGPRLGGTISGSGDYTGIGASFTPNFGYSISDAAKICGFADFNWQQTVTDLPTPSPYYQANTLENLLAPPTFFDPPPFGYTNGIGAGAYPFYWSDSDLAQVESNNTLVFVDSPADRCLFGGNGTPCGGKTAPQGAAITFTTNLVGVNYDGTAKNLGIGFNWYSTFNGTSGGIDTLSIRNPTDPGSGTGGVTIVSVQSVATFPSPVPSPQTLEAGASCNGVYGGSFNGNIKVLAGQHCTFVDAAIHGDVIVNGGNLSLSETAVDGDVDVVDSSGISISSYSAINGHLYISNLPSGNTQYQICSSSIYNGLWLHDNKADLQIGSSSQASCGGNVIVGNLEVYNNSGNTSIYNNYVSGAVVKDVSRLDNLLDLLFGNDLERIALGLPLPRLCGNKEIGGNLGVYNNKGTVSLYFNKVSNAVDIYNDVGATQVFDNTSKWLRCDRNKLISGASDTAQLEQGQCSKY